MIKFINEAITKWQVERLSAMILRMRTWLKRAEGPDPSLIKQHLGLAEEHFHDAISALKYNKHKQAFYSCQRGLAQISMAQLLTRYGAQADRIIGKAVLVQPGKRRPEEQELIAYLAASLAEMKMAIEYSNFRIGERAQALLNSAMDFYNDALAAVKTADAENAKRRAQAGLLQLNLAGQIIGAENEMSLPGWRGLSNPALGGPLRRIDELFEKIVECRTALAKLPEAKTAGVRVCYEKALRQYGEAIRSFANGSAAHAQALVRGACHDIAEAQHMLNEVIASANLPTTGWGTQDEEREELFNVDAAAKTVASLFESAAIAKNNVVWSRLQSMHTAYKDSLRALKKQRFAEAEKFAWNALLEVDLLRQFVLNQTNRKLSREEANKLQPP